MLPRTPNFAGCFVSCLCCVTVALAQAQTRPATAQPQRTAARNAAEQRAIRAFNTAKQSPLELNAFLTRMPKGADLHMHLSGAIYAETFIKDAAADSLCVDPTTLSFFKPAATTRSLPPQPVCGEGNVRAEDAFKDQKLYDALVDSFSMRSFVPSAGISGHDQFFATFDRFGGINKSHTGEWLDEVATRAAAQNEQYLESWIPPSSPTPPPRQQASAGPPPSVDPAADPHWRRSTGTTSAPSSLTFATQLLAEGLRDEVAIDIAKSLPTLSTPATASNTAASPSCPPPAP